MLSAMTNGVAQKSLRIRFPSTVEATSRSVSRPDSTPVRVCPKPILKNRQDEPASSATELDPLQNETFFRGPLYTLIASVEKETLGMVSVHDLTEAYILLSCRMETQAANLGNDTSPAVMSIRNLPSHSLCAAIRRDVACAISTSQELGGLMSSQVLMTNEEKCRAKDRSSLCHAGLRFLANFFRFPPLHKLLKLHELAWILKELLDVGLSRDLATLNPQKSYSHIIGILCNECLPVSVIRPFRSRIATIVERAAAGMLEGSVTSGPHIEGLKAIHTVLHRHGTLMFPEFQKVFKVVLQNLVCHIPTFRDIAAKVLMAFAHAALKNDVLVEDQLRYSTIVCAFIDKEVQRAKDMHKHDANSFVLRDFLKLSEDDPHIVQRTIQLLNIVAALLVLSGPCVFIRPNSLKFLVKAVEKTQSFRHRELNVLRAATWSCLVRAYCLLPSWDIPGSDGLEESAFRVVRQEYREDVGLSVIAVLLEPRVDDVRRLGHVHEAITYLYHLGEMPETRGVTATLLRRLLGGVLNDADSDTCTWTSPASIIPDWLSNGSTLDMEPRRLKKTLAAVNTADIHVVRILEADELILTWASLIEAFQICAIGQLFDKKLENSLQNDTLLLWRALLKVQSGLVPSFSRAVVSKSILECLAIALCAFLDAPRARYPIRAAQALTATHLLWKAVNDELGEVWSAALAGSIYRRLLRIRHYEIIGNAVDDEWVQLSRSLVSAAPKRTLEVLRELPDAEAQRAIWLDMVRYVRFQEHPAKEVISNLLLFPIQTTERVLKDNSDSSYWDMLFVLALVHDEPEAVCTTVSEELQRALSAKQYSELRKFFMISVTHASRSDSSPSSSLLSVVSDYLEEAYPPEDFEDNELIELIPALQRIVQAHPSLTVLNVLKNGLIPWFEDRKAFIPDIVYSNDVLPLYCDLFSAIRLISPLEEAVIALAKLLAAPFLRERIPEPAVGPIVFKEFWDEVGPTLDFRSRTFPPVLTDCVISLHNAFGGFVPEWMQSQLDSQEVCSSEADQVVPPSVEDVDSSDFSPASVKRHAQADSALATPEAQRGRRDTGVVRNPDVSPSIGEPSPQFPRYRQNGSGLSSPISLDLRKTTKKRKLVQSGATGQVKGKGCLSGSSDRDQLKSLPRDRLSGLQHGSPIDGIPSSLPQNQRKHGRMRDPDDSFSPLADAAISRRRSPHECERLEDDYTSWEIGVASQDVCDILQDDGEKTPRAAASPSKFRECNTRGSRHLRDAERDQVHRELRIDRSQTAPASLRSPEDLRGPDATELVDQHCAVARLRRTHTTTEVPLDALEKLHARLAVEADSMQTQDLAHATKLTYDVLGILNGKMSEKLENRK